MNIINDLQARFGDDVQVEEMDDSFTVVTYLGDDMAAWEAAAITKEDGTAIRLDNVLTVMTVPVEDFIYQTVETKLIDLGFNGLFSCEKVFTATEVAVLSCVSVCSVVDFRVETIPEFNPVVLDVILTNSLGEYSEEQKVEFLSAYENTRLFLNAQVAVQKQRASMSEGTIDTFCKELNTIHANERVMAKAYAALHPKAA